MAKLVVYSDAEDGVAYHSGVDYPTVHDEKGPVSYDWGGIGGLLGQGLFAGGYFIYRHRLRFDTSNLLNLLSLLDNAIITVATLSLYNYYKSYETAFDIVVVNGNELFSGTPALEYGYLLDETESRGSLNIADVIIPGYNNINLNAIAISEINKTGPTKFGLRISSEINKVTPSKHDVVSHWFFEKGEGYKPKLTIIYEVAPPPPLAINKAYALSRWEL